MGKHKNKVMSTHWTKCWVVHPDCFWCRCVMLAEIQGTTAEYQAFSFFKMALDGDFYTLRRKEVI